MQKIKYITASELEKLDNKFSILKNLGNITNNDEKLKLAHLYKDFKGLNFIGNINLLGKVKVAIIGTRSPNQYSKIYTAKLAQMLSHAGFIIVSGGAIGIDSIAHINSHPNTIMISPCGLNISYPAQNKNMIDKIKKDSLILSEYDNDENPYKFSFLHRNRIIIAISDIIIIPQADLKSGSSSSASLSIALNKEIFTLPHRMNESLATNKMLQLKKANAIFDINDFIAYLREKFKQNMLENDRLISSADFGDINASANEIDEVLEFVRCNPSYEKAFEKFGDKILLYELHGKIKREGVNLIITQ